jgi:hypothetical protein
MSKLEGVQRFPLSWPIGWKRTQRYSRKSRAPFRSRGQSMTVGEAVRRLTGELQRLGVRSGDFIVSSNLETRLDGLPYANQREPDDSGVAVYFRLRNADRVMACDTWTRVADNLAAIAGHIDAIRRVDRYGVGSLDQAFAGYVGLPAKGETWRATLGFGPDDQVDIAKVEQAFRDRARSAHPDIEGGSHDAMASLTMARDEAKRALAS